MSNNIENEDKTMSMENYKNTKERTITPDEIASFIKEIQTANIISLVIQDSQNKTIHLQSNTQEITKIVDNLLLFDSFIECKTIDNYKLKCITIQIF